MKRPSYIEKLSDGTVLDTPVKVPSPQTLRHYGLSYQAWRTMLMKQRGICAICGKIPAPSGKLVIDHFHAPNWKRMPPEKKVLYVRGLCCSTCNHYILTRYGTPAKHRAAAAYLEAFESRLQRSKSK